MTYCTSEPFHVYFTYSEYRYLISKQFVFVMRLWCCSKGSLSQRKLPHNGTRHWPGRVPYTKVSLWIYSRFKHLNDDNCICRLCTCCGALRSWIWERECSI
jgi:hypothetical protein